MAKKKEKKKWKLFWKNVGLFGMLWRLAAGVGMVAAASRSTADKTKAMALGVAGGVVALEGLMRWCSLRGVFKRPTRRAYLRHYPEAEAAE